VLCVVNPVAALLAGGANPNQPNKDVTSALHAVSQRGPVRLLQLLLEHKADVQAADNQGTTPLHLAARSGNAQKVQCLLAAGAPHGAVNSQGNTPLHLVSFWQAC
jgi:ankyrin repeat protein